MGDSSLCKGPRRVFVGGTTCRKYFIELLYAYIPFLFERKPAEPQFRATEVIVQRGDSMMKHPWGNVEPVAVIGSGDTRRNEATHSGLLSIYKTISTFRVDQYSQDAAPPLMQLAECITRLRA